MIGRSSMKQLEASSVCEKLSKDASFEPVLKDKNDFSGDKMKLRHQNNDGDSENKANKLENGVKKSADGSNNTCASKSATVIKKLPSITSKGGAQQKAADVSANNEEARASLNLSSVKNKFKVQSNAAAANLETVVVSNNKTVRVEGGDTKVVSIDVDFEDTDEDEEEDNVALKTLMENLEKGLNSGEDVKKSQAMIDDLMCDILEKDTTTDQVETAKESEPLPPLAAAVDDANGKNLAKKRDAEDKDDSKPKSLKPTPKSEDVKIISITTPKADDKKESSEIVMLTKDSGNISKTVKIVGIANLTVVDTSDKRSQLQEQSVNVTKIKSESDNLPSKADSAAKTAQSGTSENVSVIKTVVKDTKEVTPFVDDDVNVVTIVAVDAASKTANKREAESDVEVENTNKKAKSEGMISGQGVSKLESYLTRNSSESKTVQKADDVQNGEKTAARKEKYYKLTKAEFEMLVSSKVTEYFNDAHKSEIGALRDRCQQLEKMLDQWRKKATLYQKHITDFQVAVQRLQLKRPNSRPAMRSVGLQVQLIRDSMKCVNTSISTPGGKQSVMVPSLNTKNHSLVLPKQTSNNQMAFFTSLGTHGALSNATLVSNNAKTTTQNSTNTRSTVTMTVNSTTTPVPMRLIQNQAVRQVNPASLTTTVTSPPSTTSITVSVVNQPSLLSNAVKLIDLTGEEEEAAKFSSAALTSSTTLPNGLTVVPAINANSNTLTVISPHNSNVNSGQLLTLSAGATLNAVVSGVNTTVANAGAGGVTSAIRGPTTTPTTTPVRLAYLMQTGTGLMTMVRPTNGPVFVAPATQVRPTTTPVLRPSIPATLLFRQGTTLLPVQNGTVQSGQVRPVQAVQSSKVTSSTNAVTTTTTTTTTSKTIPSTNAVSTSLAKTTKTVTATSTTASKATSPPKVTTSPTHPAPLPEQRTYNMDVTGRKLMPPKPTLKIARVESGIVLSWNMSLNSTFAQISSYQLYAYQEGTVAPSSSLWKKVGDVRALPLPMACTLTQFMEGHRYHFAVRAVDVHNRVGPFSDPGVIGLFSSKANPKK